jgi:hypothetical protein
MLRLRNGKVNQRCQQESDLLARADTKMGGEGRTTREPETRPLKKRHGRRSLAPDLQPQGRICATPKRKRHQGLA